jgi:GTP cyclohydrolase I
VDNAYPVTSGHKGFSKSGYLIRSSFVCKQTGEKMNESLLTDARMRVSIRDLLIYCGEDVNREGLKETPERFLKALRFWTSGYGVDPAEVLKTFSDGSDNYDELVFQGAIPLWGLCEHHLAPFFGVAHIGYLPNKKIVGLSKLARLVEVFSRRLSVQERITTQIASAIEKHLDTEGVGVVLQCRHSCMESRGVQKIGTVTMTSALLGKIKTCPDLRAEFMTMVSAASVGIKTL